MEQNITASVNVFICYAREDQKIARQLYADLKRAGVSPWIDCEDLLPGQKWRVVIAQVLKRSAYVLALLSSSALSKQGFIQKELKTALALLDEMPPSAIFLIPVRLDNCEPLDESLQELHWVDLFPSYDAGLERLLKVIVPETLTQSVIPPLAPSASPQALPESNQRLISTSKDYFEHIEGHAQIFTGPVYMQNEPLAPGSAASPDDTAAPAQPAESSPISPPPTAEYPRTPGASIPRKWSRRTVFWVVVSMFLVVSGSIWFSLGWWPFGEGVSLKTGERITPLPIPPDTTQPPATPIPGRIEPLQSEPWTVSADAAQEVFDLMKRKFEWGTGWAPRTYSTHQYEDQGDVIVDYATGLMWQNSALRETIPYQEAWAYITQLNVQKFAGYSDWRLPTIPELLSLLELEPQKNGVYLDPCFDSKVTWVWSADRSSAEAVWCVDFGGGNVNESPRDYNADVRAVRSATFTPTILPTPTLSLTPHIPATPFIITPEFTQTPIQNLSEPNKGKETYRVMVILPSRMSGAEITVDEKPAQILEQTLCIVTIQVEKTPNTHRFTATKGSDVCRKQQVIQHDDQKIMVCEK